MSMRLTAIEAVLLVALGLDGLTEKKGNRGAEIDAMNERAHGQKGDPWCQSFVTWCGSEALGKRWPLPYTAGCDVTLNFARNRKILLESGARRGDQFLVLNPLNRNDATHTGFVTGVVSGSVNTIEGNTNAGGSREGMKVMQRVRQDTSNLVFVRWANLLDDLPEVDSEIAYTVTLNGKKLPTVLEQGVSWVDYSDALAAHSDEWKKLIGYNPELGGPLYRGVSLPKSVPHRRFGEETYVSVRGFADLLGYDLSVDTAGKKIVLVKAGALPPR